MPSMSPASIIKDKVKEILLNKIKRYLTENNSYGPEVLGPIETDIREIAVEVYKYQARFELAKKSIGAPLQSSSDYLVNCLRVGALQESRKIKELIEDLRSLGSYAGGIEERAINRSKAEAEAYREKQKMYSEMLGRYERYGNDSDIKDTVIQNLRGKARTANSYEEKAMAVDLRGDVLQRLVADLIGILKAIRQELIHSEEPFAHFARDCQRWHSIKFEEMNRHD